MSKHYILKNARVIDPLCNIDSVGDIAIADGRIVNPAEVKDPQIITWDDDSHVLPFDGTLDFRKVGETLRRCNYKGTITLEISRSRVGMPWYQDYTIEQYFATAAERAAHVARLCD